MMFGKEEILQDLIALKNRYLADKTDATDISYLDDFILNISNNYAAGDTIDTVDIQMKLSQFHAAAALKAASKKMETMNTSTASAVANRD